MSLVSNTFLIFVLLTLIIYYLVPGRLQWIVLLASSYVYYVWGGAQYVLYILFSTVVIYIFSMLITRLKEKEADRKKISAAAAAGLILNIGMLAVVKYSAPFMGFLNKAAGMELPAAGLIFPLGISFYTFQSSGYLLDVCWNRAEAERNPFKLALFISFFPQLLQGPIGKFGRLHHQFFTEHRPEAEKIKHGLYRILTGYAKKMIIADWAGVFADAIWADIDGFSGLALFAAIIYGIQLYADFSGAIDVVLGIAELFGIQLDENFKRPYLAVSITDFWKRWHVTLGDWMRNYVFYPITLSDAMKSFSRKSRKWVGKRTGRVLPIAIADLIVFFFVGIWHGADIKFVIYGMINGVIIAASELLGERYKKMKSSLHIKGTEKWYYLFTVIRTYFIVTFCWYFDRSDTLSDGLKMIKYAVTRFDLSQLFLIPAGRQGTEFVPYALLIIAVGVVIMVACGVMQEHGKDPYEKIRALPLPAVFAVYVILFLLTGFFGSTAAPKGFIYAQF